MALDNPPCSPKAFASSSNRRGRKTKTSSGASDEAPERARKDTPKEVKLHKGSYPSVRLSGEVSQASIRRVPCPQGCATVLRLPAREICFITAALAFIPAPQRLSIIPQNQVCGGKNAARTDSPPQTYPGSLCRTLLVSILIYGGNRKI